MCIKLLEYLIMLVEIGNNHGGVQSNEARQLQAFGSLHYLLLYFLVR